MKSFTSQKESSSHLNDFLQNQNSKCFDSEVKKSCFAKKTEKMTLFEKKIVSAK